jgi:hypothetical protein
MASPEKTAIPSRNRPPINWETSTTVSTLPLRDAIPPLKSPAPQAAALPMPQATASVSVLIIHQISTGQSHDNPGYNTHLKFPYDILLTI